MGHGTFVLWDGRIEICGFPGLKIETWGTGPARMNRLLTSEVLCASRFASCTFGSVQPSTIKKDV